MLASLLKCVKRECVFLESEEASSKLAVRIIFALRLTPGGVFGSIIDPAALYTASSQVMEIRNGSPPRRTSMWFSLAACLENFVD